MVVSACYYDADRLKARIDLSPVSAFRSRLPHGEALVEVTF